MTSRAISPARCSTVAIGKESGREDRLAAGDFRALQHPHRQERIAAEFEKIIADSDPAHAEHFFPNGDQLELESDIRLHRLVGSDEFAGRGRGKRGAIEMAVSGRQRDLLDRDEDGRHRLMRQTLFAQKLAQRIVTRAAIRPRGPAGDRR